MKTILNLKKTVLFITALTVAAILFTSCSDDDDDRTLAVTDVYGSYKGEISVSSALDRITLNKAGSASTEVAATVKDDTIYFENFPVEDIIIAIEGAEKASPILESIGKVIFKVGYDSELNQAQDSVGLKLNPKPMEFVYKTGTEGAEIEKNVKVTVSIPENEKSAYSDRVLKFNLIASEILLNDAIIKDFNSLYYYFNLNKQ